MQLSKVFINIALTCSMNMNLHYKYRAWVAGNGPDASHHQQVSPALSHCSQHHQHDALTSLFPGRSALSPSYHQELNGTGLGNEQLIIPYPFSTIGLILFNMMDNS